MSEPASATWSIAGEYFENCNCTVACPCIFSANAPFTSQPTEGACEVLLCLSHRSRLVRRCFAGRFESGHGGPNARADDRRQLAGGPVCRRTGR